MKLCTVFMVLGFLMGEESVHGENSNSLGILKGEYYATTRSVRFEFKPNKLDERVVIRVEFFQNENWIYCYAREYRGLEQTISITLSLSDIWEGRELPTKIMFRLTVKYYNDGHKDVAPPLYETVRITNIYI